jgi:hypothetical protein
MIPIKALKSLRAVSPFGWVGPSALKSVVLSIPGALPQAGMDRASGFLEMVPMVNPHLKGRTRAPTVRSISAWGNAPGTVKTKKEQGL